MKNEKTKIRESILKLEKWVETHNFKAYDPFDGLTSVLRPLALGNIFLEQVFEQVVKRSPINLRPFLGIRPFCSTKGMGFMAWGYLNMFKITSLQKYRDKTIYWFDWLDKNKAPGYKHHSWANHFDHVSRAGRQAKGEPDIVWTGLLGHAYIDAFERLREERYLEIIKSVASWVLNVPREKADNGWCLSYVANTQSSIHNSNMVGAGFLARASRYVNSSEALDVAREALRYSCSKQRTDGSWWYGERARHHWIDNFHTAYNLDSLKHYQKASGDNTFASNLEQGFTYWKDTFFLQNGIPRYYHNKTYPVDSQCVSQAIDTLANFAENNREALSLACKVATWVTQNMQDKDGHIYYRLYKYGLKAKTPMLHWAQTTTYKALTSLLCKLEDTP